MNSILRRWVVVDVVLAVLALFSVLVVEVGGAQRSSVTVGSLQFQDSTGDSSAAPDIATVTVSNDDTKTLTFDVRFANRDLLNPSEVVDVSIDTDANPMTGQPPYGFDYGIEVYRGPSLWRWNATTQDWDIAPMNSLISQTVSGGMIIKVGAADLGGTSKFRFGVSADANPEDQAAPVDYAPDAGKDLWAYELKLYVKPLVTLAAITVKPVAPRAGAKLTTVTRIAVVRNGVPEALPSGSKVVWRATIAAVALKPVKTTLGAAGGAQAVWKVPATAKGKKLKVSASATVEVVSVTKSVVVKLG
jgi:hypothetical protein